jgi:hypothetical protein
VATPAEALAGADIMVEVMDRVVVDDWGQATAGPRTPAWVACYATADLEAEDRGFP